MSKCKQERKELIIAHAKLLAKYKKLRKRLTIAMEIGKINLADIKNKEFT